MKLSVFKAGVGVANLRIGMTIADVKKILGNEESIYPAPNEFDKDVDDEHFLCWRSKGIEVGFDALDENGAPTDKSRVVSIHVKGRKIIDDTGASVNAAMIGKAHGSPDSHDGYGQAEKRRTWSYYDTGLQATYDKDGWLVSLCVAKVKEASKAAKAAPKGAR